MAAIAATLARYSEEIITAVTHPVSGLPSKKSWLPTIKEVHDACDELDEFQRRKIARAQGIREQMAARVEEDDLKRQKPSLEELKAKYGENWGLTLVEPRAKPTGEAIPTWDRIAETYAADPSRIKALTEKLS